MAHAVRSPPDCAVHLPGLRDMHSDECSLHAAHLDVVARRCEDYLQAWHGCDSAKAYIGNGPPAQAIPRKDGKLETDFPVCSCEC